MKKHYFNAPALQGPTRPPNLLAVEAAVQEEYVWLIVVKFALEKQSIDEYDIVSWSVYHADIQKEMIPHAAINAYCICL